MIFFSKNKSTINCSLGSKYISVKIYKTRFMKTDLPKLIFDKTDNNYYSIFNLTDEKNFIRRNFKIEYKDLNRFYFLIKKHIGERQFVETRKKVRQFLFKLKLRQSYSNIPENDLNAGYSVFKNFNDGCKDNFRMARVGKSSDYRKYKREMDNGCCGFYDNIHVINGTKYHVGFNYGH